jgi:PAS domain S-box-containing protein/putative nucleotidyltransferase with HDIG domain
VEEEAAYYSSQDAERLRDCARRVIEAGEPYEIEVRVNLPEGRIADVVALGTPVKDAHGRVIRLMGTVQDITARKQAEKAVQESEERYRQVVENASEAIFVAQHNFILFANRATSAMIGYSSEELLARPFTEFIHPDDRDMVLERYYVWMKGEELPSLYAFRVVRKDGKVRWAEVNTVLIDWQGEPATLNLASDITERREASDQLRKSLEGTIKAIALTTEMRDPYTAGHQERATRLACAIARKMGLSEERVEGLRVVGLLHDVGKVSVPAEILSKPARLTPAEFDLIKAHPQTGYEILKGIDFPWPVAEIVLEHHERLDGSGYPRGLKGEAISLEARILGVADVVEAMVSHRPYRPALGVDKALGEVEAGAGVLYDPEVVNVCLQLFHGGYAISTPLPEANMV